MSSIAVTKIGREPPNATWSNCLVVGDEIVISGLTARGPDGKPAAPDVLGQTRAIFAKLKTLMEEAGGGLHSVYKLVVYVTDVAQKDAINQARAEVFSGTFPCSTLVGATGFAFPGLLVEVDAFANRRVDLRQVPRV